MSRCKDWERLLPQYIADGEPEIPSYALLADHLRDCPNCQALAAELRVVEWALRHRPRVRAPSTLQVEILQRVERETERQEEKWQLMPSDIWVPAAVFALALLLAILLAPGQVLSGEGITELQPSLTNWPQILTQWGETLLASAQEREFWIGWSVVFALLAGLGLRLALRSWNTAASESLSRLEHQVVDAATRLWKDARRVS
ncbi:MAG: zf-HC2 domain-containing protein [Chloroflexi bacterium]|nr:zf-HC2 domain-containing protein [Chloroflexota bacterium]